MFWRAMMEHAFSHCMHGCVMQPLPLDPSDLIVHHGKLLICLNIASRTCEQWERLLWVDAAFWCSFIKPQLTMVVSNLASACDSVCCYFNWFIKQISMLAICWKSRESFHLSSSRRLCGLTGHSRMVQVYEENLLTNGEPQELVSAPCTTSL